MGDQADELRRLVAARRRLLHDAPGKRKSLRASIVAIASGKGGVGKSNIALNLALSLARRDLRVVLVDADFGAANICILGGINAPYTLHDVVMGKRELEEVLVEGPFGLKIVPGATGMAELADLDDFRRKKLVRDFRTLERRADLVLVDAGAGISKNVTDILTGADQVLMVTVPESIAIANAYSLIKSLVLSGDSPKLRLVINRAKNEIEAADVLSNMSLVARKFLKYELECLGWMPADVHLPRAVRERIPVTVKYPYSPFSRGIKQILPAFISGLDMVMEEPGGKGLFGFLRQLYRGVAGVVGKYRHGSQLQAN